MSMKFLLLPAAMMCLQGCTAWVVTDYGKAEESFFLPEGRSLVRGDTTRLYAAGEKSVNPNLLFQSERRHLMAYAVIDLKDGKIISREVIDGAFPAAAFEYPVIKPLIHNGEERWGWEVDCFIESGQDMAFVWPTVYMKNPDDSSKPYEIRIRNDKIYPRSTLSTIALPVVFVGAVATDVVVGSLRIILLPILIPLDAH
jgi:hypothetical protein